MGKILQILTVSIAPQVGLAAGLIPCGGTGQAPCSWNDLFTLLNSIIHFLIFDLGVPLVTLVIVVGGIELVLKRDQPTAKSVWKDRIQKALIGFAIILCAYLLVKVVIWGLTGGQPRVPNSDFYELRSRVNQ